MNKKEKKKKGFRILLECKANTFKIFGNQLNLVENCSKLEKDEKTEELILIPITATYTSVHFQIRKIKTFEKYIASLKLDHS